MRRLIPILGITFIDIMGFSILIPVLPYFAQHLHASPLTIGVLFSTFAACQLIAGPLWGNVSDRIGRKSVLIISQIGATLGWALLAFSHTIALVFIARVIEGVSGGNISVTQAYVSDLVEPGKRSRAFGYIGGAFSAGFIFGPLIGYGLLRYGGYPAPFLGAAALQFVTLIVTIIMLPESRSKNAEEQIATLKDIGRSLTDPSIAPILWQKLALSMGLYAWFAVLSLYLNAQFGFDLSRTMLFFSGWGVLSVILQFSIVGPMSERFGDRGMSNIGIASSVASFALVPFAHTWATLVVVFVLFAFGMALANPGITSLISNAAPSNARGSILGVASSLDNLSGVTTPPLSTGMLQRFGSPYSSLVSFAFTFIALILGMLAARRESRTLETEI
ncbi:MAG: MFS transporter [Candidatus Eremiobacteraeota bacterium]|nr:MFS transporter [Candidatus Eremiobacteraeota bacterium]